MLRRQSGILFRRLSSALAPNTHLRIDQTLSGRPIEQRDGFAKVELTTLPMMSADDRGLTHGGFYFGMADYAAMLAINDPNVVLGAAEARFLKPVKEGDVLVASANVSGEKGAKRTVDVMVVRGNDTVFTGSFTCFVLKNHVFDQ
jgi:acyl-coenzyme A thioesterase PaaI-like protein